MPYDFDNRRTGTRQLVFEADGVPLVGGGAAVYAIQAAATGLPPHLQDCLDSLRTMQAGEVAVLSANFDEVTMLLAALRIPSVRIAPEDLPLTDAKIAFAGCPHRFFRLDTQDVEPFLARGGLLVSSDRAADLPGIRHHVPVLSGQPPSLTPLAYSREHDLAGLHPRIALDPGHRPLDAEGLARQEARIMATDVQSGAPLVALIRAGNGAILHAVPHWLQDGPVEGRTAVEQRPLAEVPSLASIGNSYPKLPLGRYLRQQAMLELLLSGVAAVNGNEQRDEAPSRQQWQQEG